MTVSPDAKKKTWTNFEGLRACNSHAQDVDQREVSRKEDTTASRSQDFMPVGKAGAWPKTMSDASVWTLSAGF